jgi:hypothetical protein
MTLTPGLTDSQRQRVADILERVGGVPLGLLAMVFSDVDRQAANVFSTRYFVRAALRGERETAPRAEPIAEMVAKEHQIPVPVAAFAYGYALGVRLGRTFITPPKRPRQSISDDWSRLHEQNKATAKRYIRGLLRAQEPNMLPTRREKVGA